MGDISAIINERRELMEQLSLFQNESQNEAEQQTKKTDSFSCCSHYRECSDAKKCIMDIEGYEGCTYRTNLEKGKIFYGKNAISFNKERYSQIVDMYSSLDDDLKYLFSSIIFEFINKGKQNIMCPYSSALDKLVDLKLINSHLPYEVLNKFDFHTLKRWIKEETPKAKLPNKKDELINYIKINKPVCIYDNMINRYRTVSYPLSNISYYTELYYDFIKNSDKKLIQFSTDEFSKYFNKTA